MKKGLTIALLMVAMVALVASASAVAPTVKNLPAVIIGDVGDVSGVGTTALHLLRYENVFNLASSGVIERQSTTTANLRVYFQLNPSPLTNTLRVSNATSRTAALTDAEVTALTTAGTPPPSAKQINTTTDLYLSLVHEAGVTSAAVTAKSATPESFGATTPVLAAAGLTTMVSTISLFATDMPVLEAFKTGTGQFLVYSIVGSTDEYSPTNRILKLNPVVPGTQPSGPGLVYVAGGGTGLTPTASLTTANGVGFTGLATVGTGITGFSTWTTGFDKTLWVPAANNGTQVVRAMFKVTGNQTDATKTPGFRFLFISANYVHLGGYQVTTPGGGGTNIDSANYPSATVPVYPRLYWTVPTTQINHWTDTGLAANDFGTDSRSYFIQFDSMQLESGDTGAIVLEDVTIDKIPRPNDTIPLIQWGGSDPGALPFSTWTASASDNGTGWGLGDVTVAATDVRLRMKPASATSSVFQQVTPPVSDGTIFPAWKSDKLMRTTYKMSAADMDLCPQVRMFYLTYGQPALVTYGNMVWAEAVAPDSARYKNPRTGTSGGLIGSLKATGSTLETYIYTMNAPSVNACLLPDVDIDQATGTTFPSFGYAKPDGYVIVTGCKIEVVN